ncbi:apical endosomal glycoprotein-like [Podarcis raffonei]|uniref:apical endosomal glycoprotein-like n=1 Tax=Podarcis raffonei TaxID=65483 RepID=UPI002329887F|nr:apical endosomal glycoprotein-like [Podarcis raffonei]
MTPGFLIPPPFPCKTQRELLIGAEPHCPLWRSPASSSGAWRPLLAYTGRVRGPFQVTFSSVASVALDDVQFRNCGPQKTFHMSPFEEGWCGWAVDANQNLTWARNCSSQASPSTARPTCDHTTNRPKDDTES